MTSNLVSVILFLQGHDGKVLVARVVRTTHDVHTDAHHELGFILVLDLCPSPCPAVGYALFTGCGSALFRSGCSSVPPAVGSLFSSVGGYCWCCCELLFVLDCPDLCPLPGVATCQRRTHTTCAM